MIISIFDDEPEIFPIQYGGKARTIINLAAKLVKFQVVERVTIYSSSIRTKESNFIWHGIYFVKTDEYNVYEYIRKECDESDIISVHFCSFSFPRVENIRAKIIYNLHDILVSTQDRGSHLDKALAGKWDAIIAPSEFARDVYLNFATLFGLTNDVHVIERGIDFNCMYYIDKIIAQQVVSRLVRRNIDIHNKILFIPGRKGCGKGEAYLQALVQTLRKAKEKFLILTTLEVLEEDSVVVIDWIQTENMRYFYSIADVTVNFSMLPESFSNICLESIACKTPVVCFGFGNLKKLTKEFNSILLMQPNNESIFKGVHKAFNINSSVMLNDYKKVKISNSIDHIAELYLRTYQNLISKGYRHFKVNTVKRGYMLSPYAYLGDEGVWINNNGVIEFYALTKKERGYLENEVEDESLNYLIIKKLKDKKIVISLKGK